MQNQKTSQSKFTNFHTKKKYFSYITNIFPLPTTLYEKTFINIFNSFIAIFLYHGKKIIFTRNKRNIARLGYTQEFNRKREIFYLNNLFKIRSDSNMLIDFWDFILMPLRKREIKWVPFWILYWRFSENGKKLGFFLAQGDALPPPNNVGKIILSRNKRKKASSHNWLT